MTRRDVLGLFGAAGVALRAQEVLRFTNLDHVEFFTSHVEKAVAFYARVFGNTVSKNNKTSRRYVKLGASYIAMDDAGAAGLIVDHFCAGIPGYNIETMHAFLKERGIAYKDYPSGRDLSVADADGTRMQLATDKGWAVIPASPETISVGEPIFRPLRIDHVVLNVSDPEKAAEAMAKMLGPGIRRGGRTWFAVGRSTLGLQKTPAGEKAGVNRTCVLVEPFAYQAAVQQLEAAGAKMDFPDAENSALFRDLDGYRVEVLGEVQAA